MRIAADGTWFYNGSPIGRLPLVKLFASILRKDPERYVLVTPVERVGIAVEDAPFQARRDGGRRRGRRAPHRLPDQCRRPRDGRARSILCASIATPAGGVKPYVRVRGGLWARVTRALTYDLVALGEERELGGRANVRSGRRRELLPDRASLRGGGVSDDMLAASRELRDAAPPAISGLSRPASSMRSTDPNGDHALEKAGWPGGPPLRPKPAAVLVPVVMHDEEATILFTERASHLRDHSGQIALPGGKIDPGRDAARHGACARPRRRSGSTRASSARSVTSTAILPRAGFIVFPVVGLVTPGLHAPAQCARGRGRLRGAAVFPHGSGKPPDPRPRMEGRHPPVLRDALRPSLHLGCDGGHPSQSLCQAL